MDFYGLHEEDTNEATIETSPEDLAKVKSQADKDDTIKVMENEAPAGLDRLIDVAEEIFDDGAGMSLRSLDELLDDVKKHMLSKYGE